MELKYIDASEAIEIATRKNDSDFIVVMNPIFEKIRTAAAGGYFYLDLFDCSLEEKYKQELVKRGYKVNILKDGLNEYKTNISWEIDDSTSHTASDDTCKGLHLYVMCDGPQIQAYNFYVSADEYSGKKLTVLKGEIQKACEINKRGFVGIKTNIINVPKSAIWKYDTIIEVIRTNAI